VLVRNEREFLLALDSLLADPVRLARMKEASRAYAQARPFSKSAEQLAAVLLR